MKKLALILALMLIPCSAFGLEMLTDNALDNVTGQAGVAIAADDIQIFLNVERFAWIDADGFGTMSYYGGEFEGTTGGAIFIDNFQLDMLNINMIGGRGTLAAYKTSDDVGDGNGVQTMNAKALGGSDSGVIELFYDYGNTDTMGAMLTGSYAFVGNTQTLGMDNYLSVNPNGTSPNNMCAKPITIDATAALPLLTAGWRGNSLTELEASSTIGGVLIGFPTMEIYINQMVVTPRFTAQISNNSANAVSRCYNEGQSYGTFEMQGITFSVLSGWMEIAPTGRPGDGL